MFCGEIGIENFTDPRWIYAGTLVFYNNLDVSPRINGWNSIRREVGVLQSNIQVATIGHSFAGVNHEIGKDLLNLPLISINLPQIVSMMVNEVHIATRKIETLQSKNHALNANLREAESDFTDLRLLGVALAARHKLDNLRWDASLDQFDANRRRKAQRDRWLEVLKTMASEREAGASTAESTVVTDPGVQERFNRLLDLLKYHTGLQTLKFCGKEVQLNGVAASNTLSEGQTVLVNIAATIAVVGKVAGTAEHRPGWIVFDEPTNGLDEEGRNQVAEYLGGLSITDVPSQIVVATFDTKFAEKLITKATATGRRGKHVELQDFKPGSTVQPKIREF